ncbi:transcription factor S [Candidatus Woesearchaeota archaeon]|nr:transcription factor S [Candidatus Woesearchaeota archaeon]
MKFCPKCGSILMPKGKFLVCSCGYKEAATETKVSEKAKDEDHKIEVAEAGSGDVRSVVEEQCPKCGHMKCYTWEIQMRAADEPATRFFECQKCHHKWRDQR